MTSEALGIVIVGALVVWAFALVAVRVDRMDERLFRVSADLLEIINWLSRIEARLDALDSRPDRLEETNDEARPDSGFDVPGRATLERARDSAQAGPVPCRTVQDSGQMGDCRAREAPDGDSGSGP